MHGIIGFIRILRYSKNDFLTIKENYIEFDTDILKNFHQYYFQYFLDKYNIAKKIEGRIDNSFEKIKWYLENDLEKKEMKDGLKTEEKYIRAFLKPQIDKIKKIDEVVYDEVINDYNEIEKIKGKEDLEKLDELRNCLIENFKREKINQRITLNLFKSILSNTYFGQQSFLNVVKSSLSYEEQVELMYRDYVSNIVETGILHDILQDRYNLQSLEKLIQEKQEDKLITQDFRKIYANVDKKFVQKKKEMEEIKEYIQNTVFGDCAMCSNSVYVTSDYTEGNFVPLAVSSSNMTNFFWNQNAKFPICDVCKLILFCIPAGITTTIKTVKENNTYKEKEILTFINYDTDVNTLLKTNNYFAGQLKKDKMQYNPYGDLILNIVEQNKKISEWELQNIFVVEFEAEYLAFSRIQYFNIQRHVAKFFKSYSYLLNQIKDYKYKLQIVDDILKNRDFTKVINQRLREEIGKENRSGYYSYLVTQIQYTLEILKKEERNVKEKIEKANARIHVMFVLGNEIHDKLKEENNENKLDGYIYQMLNFIKTNNKSGFIDIAIRIIWSFGKNTPEILVQNNENLKWQELGHSFIAGLTSPKYLKKGEENKDGE